MSRHEEVFSEAEVTEIVRRAVELQEMNQAASYVPGVTRDELDRIAREIGVNREYLDRALQERLNPQPAKPSIARWFGLAEERVVDGELAPEDYDLLADELPTRASQAPPSQVGRTLTAKVMTGINMADVKVTARNGRTRVRVAPFPILPCIFGLQAMLLGTGIGAGIIGDKGPIAVGAAVIAAGVVGGFGLLIGGVNHGKAAAKRLADRLADRIRAETGQKD